MGNSSRSDTRWSEFFCNTFSARIMLFVGDRKEMIASVAGAFGELKSLMGDEMTKEFVKKIRLYCGSKISGADGECISVTASSGAKLWIVRVDDFDGSVDGVATLSHECLHAALSVLDCCGVSENPPFECLCYLHGAIFKKFLIGASAHIGLLRKHSQMKHQTRKDM